MNECRPKSKGPLLFVEHLAYVAKRTNVAYVAQIARFPACTLMIGLIDLCFNRFKIIRLDVPYATASSFFTAGDP